MVSQRDGCVPNLSIRYDSFIDNDNNKNPIFNTTTSREKAPTIKTGNLGFIIEIMVVAGWRADVRPATPLKQWWRQRRLNAQLLFSFKTIWKKKQMKQKYENYVLTGAENTNHHRALPEENLCFILLHVFLFLEAKTFPNVYTFIRSGQWRQAVGQKWRHMVILSPLIIRLLNNKTVEQDGAPHEIPFLKRKPSFNSHHQS